jgi:hypothetical protein
MSKRDAERKLEIELAIQEIDRQIGRRGTGTPGPLGPGSDVPTTRLPNSMERIRELRDLRAELVRELDNLLSQP